MNSGRYFRWLLLTGFAAALAAGVALASRGGWSHFGAFVAGLPAEWKSEAFRRAYLARWVLPASAAYVVVLCGGIFFGLRRLRKGAR